tara:strand:+ start:157 stop:294 length:138 start_codon:yes stop_codon:yes gene_type:complete
MDVVVTVTVADIVEANEVERVLMDATAAFAFDYEATTTIKEGGKE